MKKRKTEDRYLIELNKVQLKTISRALDFYSRILCGQLDELKWNIDYQKELRVNRIERKVQVPPYRLRNTFYKD